MDAYDLSQSGTYDGPNMGEQRGETSMSVIVRETESEADIHIEETWENEYGDQKMAVPSQKKHSDIFNEKLKFEIDHQKWKSSERVENQEAWAVDVSALGLVVLLYVQRGLDITVSDSVYQAYCEQELERRD